jgi:hypothetical protein
MFNFDFKNQRGSSEGGGAGPFLGMLAIAGILLFGFWYLSSGFSPYMEKNNPIKPTDEAAKIKAGKKYTVEIMNQGFIPTVLTAHPYDTISFANNDAPRIHQIDSDCPELDAKPYPYSIIFTTTKTCNIHDHAVPAFKAVIKIVKP